MRAILPLGLVALFLAGSVAAQTPRDVAAGRLAAVIGLTGPADLVGRAACVVDAMSDAQVAALVEVERPAEFGAVLGPVAFDTRVVDCIAVLDAG